MAGIRSSNTGPERAIRSALHRLGFRFTLHNRRLRGTPDIVLPRYRAVIFVHGCFWHGHSCSLYRLPATRTEFWRAKADRNRTNDITAQVALLDSGWRVATVWECALRGRTEDEIERLLSRLAKWLRSSSRTLELFGPGPGISPGREPAARSGRTGGHRRMADRT